MNDFRYWFKKTTQEDIRELLEVSSPFFFRFRDNDYHIERFIEGVAIRKPVYFYIEDIRGMGYNVEYPDSDYPGSFEAKSVEEFMRLPFLDGKTIFERFEELRFFEI